MAGGSPITLDRLAELGLIDQHRAPMELALPARGPIVVVFIRGHWCPYCRRYLCKLQQHLPRVRELGARVLVISPEPPETSAAMLAQLRVAIPVFSDPEGRAISLFNVRNSFAAARTLMPHPAVFIFHSNGTMSFRSIDRNYKSRTSMRTILNELRKNV